MVSGGFCTYRLNASKSRNRPKIKFAFVPYKNIYIVRFTGYISYGSEFVSRVCNHYCDVIMVAKAS